MARLLNKYPALSHKDFRLWWIGQFISTAGNQMQLVAVNWHIYLLTHSAVALGLIGLSRFVPIIFFSPLGGITADIYNRKRINLIAQFILTLIALILAITTYTGIITAPILFFLTILSSICGSFESPSRSALVPNLVLKKELSNAMSLLTIMRESATVIGPGIAGFMIAYAGIGSVYLTNALSFGAIIYSLLVMSQSGNVISKTTTFSLKGILEGIHFVRKNTILWSTMLLDFFSTFFSSATVLLPIFAKDILLVGPTGLGLLYAAPSVGAVIAGIFLAHPSKIHQQGKLLFSGIFLYAVGTIMFGFSKWFIISLGALFIIGFGDSVSTVLRNTIRQAITPDQIRGRMVSINMIFYMGGPQLGEFEAGILAALIGTPLSVVIGGIGTILVLVVMASTIPEILRFREM